ncbi:MAG: adenylate/guanylate cyclase domain-containing protein [candidate division WOR-3 bacterium]|nr:adenylate/guanylate cyclase domain-containing protein [candidate division WOR-3 bacterium]
MNMRVLKIILIPVFVTIIVNILCLYKPLYRPFEQKLYDLKYQLTIGGERSDNIIIVDIDELSLEKLGRYQNWPRVYFAEVIDYLKGAKVIGVDIFFGEPDTLPIYAQRYYDKPNFDSILGVVIANNKNVVLVSSYNKEPVFENVCPTGVGEIIADEDGIVRHGYKIIGKKHTFAYEIARKMNFDSKDNKFLICYRDTGAFRRIPFSDVYLRRVPPEYFQEKVVLIGGTAPGLFDFHSVPFHRHFPGILIQANLLDNFITNKRIAKFPYHYVLIITIFFSSLIALLTNFSKLRVYVFGCIVIFLIILITSFVLFSRRIDLEIIRIYYSFILTIIVSLINRYQFEEREKRRLKSIFSRYYSRELVEKVIKEPPKLGGEKVFCSILFADIRNFTPFSEKSSPEEVAKQLNRFLTEMVMIVFKYQGRIDKFIGDCVMAVFGHPVKLKNSALNACLCAREMVRRSEDLGFKIGIGINSGEVVSGNFGSPMRMEYTVIGDAVNLASRLEGLTKDLGVNIIVGEETYKMVTAHPTIELHFKELGPVKVKGKEEGVSIYELIP